MIVKIRIEGNPADVRKIRGRLVEVLAPGSITHQSEMSTWGEWVRLYLTVQEKDDDHAGE